MGVLMFNARIHDLIRQKHELEYKLTKLTKKTGDMARYSALVANGGDRCLPFSHHRLEFLHRFGGDALGGKG